MTGFYLHSDDGLTAVYGTYDLQTRERTEIGTLYRSDNAETDDDNWLDEFLRKQKDEHNFTEFTLSGQHLGDNGNEIVLALKKRWWEFWK